MLPLLYALSGPSDILKAVFYCLEEEASVCSFRAPVRVTACRQADATQSTQETQRKQQRAALGLAAAQAHVRGWSRAWVLFVCLFPQLQVFPVCSQRVGMTNAANGLSARVIRRCLARATVVVLFSLCRVAFACPPGSRCPRMCLCA